MIETPQLIETVTRLALNYGRTLADDALAGMVDTWRQQIGACTPADVDAATRTLLADPKVTKFPTVAEFRQFVIRAAQERQRAKLADGGDAGPACVKCEDTGWLDAGTDDDGYGYVAKCPDGCMPPLPGARFRQATHRRRRRPRGAHQQSLAEVLPDGVIEAQHRMLGEHGQDDNPEF